MSTYDTLNRAAEIMMERGHTKGTLEDDDGRVCLMGSVFYAVPQDMKRLDSTLRRAATDALVQVLDAVPSQWNDRPETTEAMAIGALHEAAIYAKEHGL